MTAGEAREVLQRRVKESIRAKSALLDPAILDGLAVVADVLVDCATSGRTVFFAGNGGSATDAEHLSAELLGRYLVDRSPLASVCLSSNTSALTAIANDYGYDEVFARPLRGLGRAGDVLVVLTTSGNSANVIRAVEVAREIGVVTVGFTGADGGKVGPLVDHLFRAPSTETPRIQECHLLAGHTLCEIVELATVRP